MCHRRKFIAGTAAALGMVPFAAATQETRRSGYVCPPCGCASDGKIFDAPGKCPSCGLTLISLEASEAMRAAHAGDAAITFQSHGAMLAGAIVFPDILPPVAGLVLVHGSGKVERMLPLARLLAASGFAVLTYDKRGVGMSGGTYEEMENVSAANLDLLSDDAGAALAALQGDARVQTCLSASLALAKRAGSYRLPPRDLRQRNSWGFGVAPFAPPVSSFISRTGQKNIQTSGNRTPNSRSPTI
jgi:hypothetical protein